MVNIPCEDDWPRKAELPHGDGPRPIRDVLCELLAQYELRFPGAQVTVVEQPAESCPTW